MLRRLTERLTRDWTLRRQLPQEFGSAPILVTPSAGLRYLARSMNDVDPVLMNLVKEFVRPGSVVWDIGANVGLFTFAAASLAGPEGQVMAMEPDAWLVQLLRRSAKLQPPGSAPVQDRAGSRGVEPGIAHLVSGGEVQGGELPRGIRHDPDRWRS